MMIDDDYGQSDHMLDTDIMVDVVRIETESSFHDFELTGQIDNVETISTNVQSHQLSTNSPQKFDEKSKIEDESNQQPRPKRNLLINSKRPKSQYHSSIQSNSKKITQKSLLKSAIRQKKHTCSNCNKTFTRSFHLTRHLTTTSCVNQNNITQYQCDKCGKIYNRKDNLQEHLRTHAGETTRNKPYKCTFCDKRYHGISLLQIHERVHTGERPFQCSHCEKRFVSQNALNKHTRTHTGERPYPCSECEMSFTLKGTLNRHMYTHSNKPKPHICQYCQKEFIQMSNLKAHLFYHTGENGFKCDCGREFNRLDRLQMHIKYVHEKGNKKFLSVIKNTAKQQKSPKHPDTNREIFKCPNCKSEFNHIESLKVHEIIHDRQPPSLNCSLCSRVFLNQDFLNKHVNVQHQNDSSRPSTSRTMDIDIAVDMEVGLDSNDESSMNSIESIGEICLRDEAFIEKLQLFLNLLIDEQASKFPNGSNVCAKDLMEFLYSLVRRYGKEPIIEDDTLDECDQLRANLNLFLVCIDDQTFKNLLDNHSIDEVLLYLVN